MTTIKQVKASEILEPTMQKWDFKTHTYSPYVPPKGVHILFSPNMELEINCTNCNDGLTYGQGFTSRTIHNTYGMGWPVCEKCYEKEWEDERKSKDIN